MKTIINVTAQDVKILQEMISDLETGYMANPSVAADKRRLKYEKALKSMLARVQLSGPHRSVDDLPHITTAP